eukprot:scaffold193885_cov39-Tisochrysis_lutea.AAC.1
MRNGQSSLAARDVFVRNDHHASQQCAPYRSFYVPSPAMRHATCLLAVHLLALASTATVILYWQM